MAISQEEATALLGTLRESLLEAGYAQAAQEVARVSAGPLASGELDAPIDERVAAASMRSDAEIADEADAVDWADVVMLDPTPRQRLAAAIRVVDLLVLQPVRVAIRLPAIWDRADLDVVGVRLGDGDNAAEVRRDVTTDLRAVERMWTSLLEDIRGSLRRSVDG